MPYTCEQLRTQINTAKGELAWLNQQVSDLEESIVQKTPAAVAADSASWGSGPPSVPLTLTDVTNRIMFLSMFKLANPLIATQVQAAIDKYVEIRNLMLSKADYISQADAKRTQLNNYLAQWAQQGCEGEP